MPIYSPKSPSTVSALTHRHPRFAPGDLQTGTCSWQFITSLTDNLRLCYGRCTAETAARGSAELTAWRDRFLVDLLALRAGPDPRGPAIRRCATPAASRRWRSIRR